MINESAPNADLIRAVAEVLDGETWEVMHRLTTSRVRPTDGQRQEIETTVEYNPDHGWRLEAVHMDSGLRATSNSDHDLDKVVLGARWEALDQ